jgi:putative transposase
MIKCPRCNSKKLYKYGKDPETGKQKYQCKKCRRQFKPGDKWDGIRKRHPWLPRCPKCNYRMEIFKWRKHFKRLRCKKCNYKYNVYSIPEEVLDYASRASSEKDNFKRMRYSKEIILKAIRLCYEFGLSSRDISKNFFAEYGFKISHVSIYQWCRKFSYLFEKHIKDVKLGGLSKTWHIDETVLKIKGEKHWLFSVLDRKSRFVISWYLAKARTVDACLKVLSLAHERAGFKPNRLVSDRHSIYQEVKKAKPRVAKENILVGMFSDKLSNNRIERFFGTIKSRSKRARGFKSFYSTVCFLTTYIGIL